MGSSGECMMNDTALMTLGGGSCVFGGEDQVWGGRGNELNMKWQGKP